MSRATIADFAAEIEPLPDKMSTEDAVADSSSKPVDHNAQAAQDTEKLLAELQGDAASTTQPEAVTKPASATNGDQNGAIVPKEENGTLDGEKEENARPDRTERRDGGRGGRGGRGGGRGRGGHKSFRDNIKSDLTTQEVTDDPVAIRKQVEFYFSDSNLPMDKFLLGKVGGSQNNPVEIKILHSFKRMRRFQPFDAIVNALKDSTFLELTDDDKYVRRREPLPESLNDGADPNAVKVFEDKAMPRSVYVKGFGEELPSTQFDIEAFFAPYGPTNAIRLRRTDTKVFKGSVFAEFEDEELAKKFLDLDPKPKYKGNDLQIMSKKEYCDKKVEDIKSGKIKPNEGRKFNQRRDERKSGRDFKRKRDDEDDRDWRERREQDRKNGFKDDKRRGGHRDRDSRDKGRKDFKERQVERDDRGVPVIKTSTGSDEKNKKDSGKEDALAKARAAVEAEKQKEGKEAADTVSEGVQADTEVAGKKRAREEDHVDNERDAKKVDVKVDT